MIGDVQSRNSKTEVICCGVTEIDFPSRNPMSLGEIPHRGVEGQAAQDEQDLWPEDLQLLREVGRTTVYLLCRGSIPGWSTSHGRRNVGSEDLKTVVSGLGCRLAC